MAKKKKRATPKKKINWEAISAIGTWAAAIATFLAAFVGILIALGFFDSSNPIIGSQSIESSCPLYLAPFKLLFANEAKKGVSLNVNIWSEEINFTNPSITHYLSLNTLPTTEKAAPFEFNGNFKKYDYPSSKNVTIWYSWEYDDGIFFKAKKLGPYPCKYYKEASSNYWQLVK
ncbi:MAG: hypothetical protein AABX70_03190 [Nanoarchaeota archaeon]